jgi:hypothetical protein
VKSSLSVATYKKSKRKPKGNLTVGGSDYKNAFEVEPNASKTKQKNIPSYFEENLDITNNIYDHRLYQRYRTNDAIIKSYYNVNELPQDLLKKL